MKGSDIKIYYKCPTWLYLDYHGPDEWRKEHVFMQKKAEEGLEYEEYVMNKLGLQSIKIRNITDWSEKTIQLMKENKDIIGGALLKHGDYIAQIDLLRKNKEGHYEVVDIKIAKKPHKEHIMQVVYNTMVLGMIQKVTPEKAYLKLVDGREEEIPVKENMEKLVPELEHINSIIHGEKIEPSLGGDCKICAWSDYCLEQVIKTRDITLINGLGREKKKLLQEYGIATLEQLAKIDADMKIKGVGNNTLQSYKLKAQSLLEKKEIITKKYNFPKSKLEIFLDFEGSPTHEIDWIIGLEIRNGNDRTIKSFIAEKPDDEKEMYKQFLDYMENQNNYIIYHYHHYEKTALTKLQNKYGYKPETHNKIMSSLLDLYKIINDSIIFPLHSNSLKSIAKYLGFKWRESDVDAATSIYLYDLWLTTKNREYLKKAVEYNQDDCGATRTLLDYLKQKLS